MRICCVGGARPNFMKLAAVMRALEPHRRLEAFLVHTGQHYDRRLSGAIVDDLGLPEPAVNLGVGSGSHADQTAAVMQRFDPVVAERAPDLVLVVGDVNSTVACALVAAKRGVAVAHVEAGLRSFDRSMPEEINRLVTDALSDLLFVSERSGIDNLRREGVPDDNVFFVGNVMVDTLLRHRGRAAEATVVADLGLEAGGYAAVTLHRPANVDPPERLAAFAAALGAAAERLPVVFPAHPRTARRLAEEGLIEALRARPGLHLIEPLGYLDFLRLVADARVVLTDSGGIQEEATVLGVPCLTLRDNTERPATVESGCNRVIGSDPAALVPSLDRLLAAPPAAVARPELWDGRAGERIAAVLASCTGGGLARLRARRAGGGSAVPAGAAALAGTAG